MRQLSIFAENKKGNMKAITEVLAQARVNMNTLITNDSAEYGIIRMLVSDADLAAKALGDAGYLCRVDTVLAVEISDDCGSLNSLLGIILEGNINIDYLYVTYNNFSKNPVAILRTADLAEVEEFLEGKGYTLLQSVTQ